MNQKLKEYLQDKLSDVKDDLGNRLVTFEDVSQTVNHFLNERDEKVKKLVEEYNKHKFYEIEVSEVINDLSKLLKND